MAQRNTDDAPKHRDPEWLVCRYRDENATMLAMAEEAGVTRQTIRHWLREYGIERKYADPEVLHDLLYVRGLSLGEAAAELNCSPSTVRKHQMAMFTDVPEWASAMGSEYGG